MVELKTSTGHPDTARQIWRNSRFLLLFSGNTALLFGYASTLLLRSMLAWELTHDYMSLAYINLVSAACVVIGSVFSGAAVDCFERRRLMVIAHSVILLADTLSLTAGYIFLVLLYSASLLSVSSLQPSRQQRRHKSNYFADIRQGFTYVLNHRPLAVCLLFGILPMMVLGPAEPAGLAQG